MEILAKTLAELVPADYNPRAISEHAMEGLRASVKRFGLVEPIVWNRRTGRVVGGHQRLKVLLESGVEETLVVAVDLPEAEEKALNVTLNNPGVQGHFTKDLQVVLEAVRVEIPDVFIELHLDDLHFEMPADGDGVADAVPAKAKKRTKPGELWACDRHRVLCGDATKAASWAALMGGRKARMAFTDPPYKADYNADEPVRVHLKSGGKPNKRRMGKIIGDDIPQEEYKAFLRACFGYMLEALKAGGTFYLCCNYPSIVDLTKVLETKNVLLSAALVWDKGAMILDRKDYHASHEFMLYGWRKGAAHVYRGPANETDTWMIKQDPSASYEHPTQKPVALADRAIRNSSRAGDTVIDCFGGSGSTLIACEQLDRDCRLMELDPKFCDVILARWERFTGRKAERVKATAPVT